MRIILAKSVALSALVGLAFLLCSTAQADSITTLSGKTYEVTKVLKEEEDGITVKHKKGIAKIPFFELDAATREQYGHTGDVTPSIRHRPAPDASLLPGLDENHGLDEIELDLDAAAAAAENEIEESVTVTEDTGTPAKTRTSTTRTMKQNEVVVRKLIEVKVHAIGCAAKARGGYSSGPNTTNYTPYGNYSYRGLPGGYPDAGFGHVLHDRHLYFIPPPPCNRRNFERRDLRRWQGNGRRTSRISFAHYPN